MDGIKEKSGSLKTGNLMLRSLSDGDREAMRRMLTDEKIKKTYMIPDFSGREQEDVFFDRLKALSEKKDRFVYGISLQEDLIGFINECGRDGKSVEIGYFIASEHWGRGYATQALRAALAELFRMGFECVAAGFFEENPASSRVMEKAGMHPADRESVIEYRGRKHRCLYREIENNASCRMVQGDGTDRTDP